MKNEKIVIKITGEKTLINISTPSLRPYNLIFLNSLKEGESFLIGLN